MEGEKPSEYIPPMNGQGAFDMFGDRALLILEAEHKAFELHLKEVSNQIAVLQEDPEVDWEDIEELKTELQTTHDKMREHDRKIRKVAQDFGNKRGPVTLR